MDGLDNIKCVHLAQKGLMVNRLMYRLLHMHEMNLNDRLEKLLNFTNLAKLKLKIRPN